MSSLIAIPQCEQPLVEVYGIGNQNVLEKMVPCPIYFFPYIYIITARIRRMGKVIVSLC